MAKVIGIENKTVEQIFAEIGEGSRFIVHHYCVSVLIMSFKQPSAIYFIRDGERRWGTALGCSAISLVAGWWGIPWGPIWTVSTTVTNLAGGKDVTEAMMASLQQYPADTMVTSERTRNLAQVFD